MCSANDVWVNYVNPCMFFSTWNQNTAHLGVESDGTTTGSFPADPAWWIRGGPRRWERPLWLDCMRREAEMEEAIKRRSQEGTHLFHIWTLHCENILLYQRDQMEWTNRNCLWWVEMAISWLLSLIWGKHPRTLDSTCNSLVALNRWCTHIFLSP